VSENSIEAFRLPPESADASAAPASAVPAEQRSQRTRKRGRERIPRQQQAFIRGPLPLPWFECVFKIPGSTVLRLALALFYQSGLEGSATIRLTQKLMDRFHIAPRSASRTLERMQAAGLVRVQHKPGRCHAIEILRVQTQSVDRDSPNLS